MENVANLETGKSVVSIYCRTGTSHFHRLVQLAAFAGAASLLPALVLAQPATAVTVNVESVHIASSPTSTVSGLLDVFVTLNPAVAAPPVAAFQSQVILDPSASGKVAFVSPFAQVTTEAAHPQLISGNFVTPLGTGDTDDAFHSSASAFDGSGSTPFVDGAGLFEVPFTVQPGVTGNFPVVLDLNSATGTFLSDANGNPISYSAVNGAIDVTPEPSAVGLLAAGSVGILAWCRRA